MISDQSKDKLINSFDSLTMAVHNMKACVASEGKRAFADGDTQAISELLVIMTKVNEVTSKINKLAPTFRSYRLDLATKNNNNSKSLEIEDETQVDKIVKCYIRLNSESEDRTEQKITCLVEILKQGDIKFTLKATQVFSINTSNYPSDTKKRFMRAISLGDIRVIGESDGMTSIVVNRDMQFKSANSICSFVLCKKVRDGLNLIKIAEDNSPISTLLLS